MLTHKLNLFNCCSGKKLNKFQELVINTINGIEYSVLWIATVISSLIYPFIILGIIGLIFKYLIFV